MIMQNDDNQMVPVNPTEPARSGNCSPFEVPPFDPPKKPITFIWWSWHPLYPYWSQSCWAAPTIAAAQEHLQLGRLACYHNKLIRHDGVTLEEVQDEPCREMDVWHKIKRQMDEANSQLTKPGLDNSAT